MLSVFCCWFDVEGELLQVLNRVAMQMHKWKLLRIAKARQGGVVDRRAVDGAEEMESFASVPIYRKHLQCALSLSLHNPKLLIILTVQLPPDFTTKALDHMRRLQKGIAALEEGKVLKINA